MYQFVDLDPGDLYTIEMVVLSLGDDVTRVERRYTFYDSTHPLQPTIVTNVTVTEHAVHFGWTNEIFYQVRTLLSSRFSRKTRQFHEQCYNIIVVKVCV